MTTVNRLTLIIGNKNYSSWSLRPWLLLKMLDMDFNEVRIPLDTAEFAQTLRAYSPAGRVPVLVHQDLHIWDSLAICEYVREQYVLDSAGDCGLARSRQAQTSGSDGWPEDRTARARARSISAEMHAGFTDLRATMPMNCRRRCPGFKPTAAAQTDIDRIVTIWEDCLPVAPAAGQWLFGSFSIADAMFAPVVMRFLTYDVELPARARQYLELVVSCPPMREWQTAAAAETEVLEGEEVDWP